jgi:hypothetical protein
MMVGQKLFNLKMSHQKRTTSDPDNGGKDKSISSSFLTPAQLAEDLSDDQNDDDLFRREADGLLDETNLIDLQSLNDKLLRDEESD